MGTTRLKKTLPLSISILERLQLWVDNHFIELLLMRMIACRIWEKPEDDLDRLHLLSRRSVWSLPRLQPHLLRGDPLLVLRGDAAQVLQLSLHTLNVKLNFWIKDWYYLQSVPKKCRFVEKQPYLTTFKLIQNAKENLGYLLPHGHWDFQRRRNDWEIEA